MRGRDRRQFQLVQNTSSQNNPSNGPIRGVEPATGDGIPDTNFLTGVRNGTISEGGVFASSCPTVAATGESAAAFAACPLNWRVGENSPSLWPTIFSVT